MGDRSGIICGVGGAWLVMMVGGYGGVCMGGARGLFGRWLWCFSSGGWIVVAKKNC